MKSEHVLRTLIRELLDGFGNKNLGKDTPTGNLRYDVSLRDRGGNVLDDEQEEISREQQSKMLAAAVLCIAEDGKVLAVSRRDDPTMLGLPGGSVDPGETPMEAAARELYEETGLTATNLNPIFASGDSDGYTTITFVGHVTGNIKTDESGVIRWVHPKVLVDPVSSPFTDYNTKLFVHLGVVT